MRPVRTLRLDRGRWVTMRNRWHSRNSVGRQDALFGADQNVDETATSPRRPAASFSPATLHSRILRWRNREAVRGSLHCRDMAGATGGYIGWSTQEEHDITEGENVDPSRSGDGSAASRKEGRRRIVCRRTNGGERCMP